MRLFQLTARHMVLSARLALAPAIGALAAAILLVDAAPASAAAAAFLCGVLILQSAPRLRGSDLLGLLALLATLLEWLQAGFSGQLDTARWQACIAVFGAMAMLLKVQHLRSLAREDPYVPLRQLERRNVLLGRTTARLPGIAEADEATP